VQRRPDNPFTETGIKTEFSHHGLSARLHSTRVDRNHMWIDPILVGGPYAAALGGAIAAAAWVMRRRNG
jgi:hypothetical protein